METEEINSRALRSLPSPFLSNVLKNREALNINSLYPTRYLHDQTGTPKHVAMRLLVLRSPFSWCLREEWDMRQVGSAVFL